jgi:hypothetical protein
MNNPQRKEVVVDDVVYPSIKKAAKYIGCWPSVLTKVLNKGLTEFKGHSISYA